MKMKPEHFTILKRAIHETMNSLPLGTYSQYQTAGLSDRRYRWDLLYRSKIKIGDGIGIDGLPLYAYLNDGHIDTALKAITNT